MNNTDLVITESSRISESQVSVASISKCSSLNSTTKIMVVSQIELKLRISQRTGSEISQTDYRDV